MTENMNDKSSTLNDFFSIMKEAIQSGFKNTVEVSDKFLVTRMLRKGTIEWAKANQFTRFFLGCVDELIDTYGNKNREELVSALKSTPFEEIEKSIKDCFQSVCDTKLKIHEIDLHQIKIEKLLAGISKAIGEIPYDNDLNSKIIFKSLLSLRTISRKNKEEVLSFLKMILSVIEPKLDSIEEKADISIEYSQETIELSREILSRMDKMPELLRWVIRDEKDEEYKEFEREYLNAVKDEYGSFDLLGIGQLEQSFDIDPAFVSLSMKDSSINEIRSEESYTALSDQPELVIVGSAGAGKSTMLQWEAFQCTRGKILKNGQINPWYQCIPFFIRLRNLDPGVEFPPKSEWVKLSVPDWEEVNGDHGKWIGKILKENRALLILDGLDEMPEKDRPGFWRGLNKLIRSKNILYRVSSRPFHQEGINDELWGLPVLASELNVLPLSQDKVNLLIDKWHDSAVIKENTGTMRKELKKYKVELKDKLWNQPEYRVLNQLTKTPFLCAAICLINRYSKEKLPVCRSDFFKILCDALLERDNRKKRKGEKSITEPYNKLDVRSLMKIHSHLAFHMIMNPMTWKGETTESYKMYAKESDVLEWIKVPIKFIKDEGARKKAEDNPKKFLQHLIDRRNLLREPGKGYIDFHHRSLQEYLAATELAKNRWLNFLIEKAEEDRWHDIIIMSAGGYLAGEEFGNQLIEALLECAELNNSRICYSLAVACLETANLPDPDTRKLAIEGLKNILPPKSLEDVRIISSAGSAAIKLLSWEKMKKEDGDFRVFCVLTLLNIGGIAIKSIVKEWGEDTISKALIQAPAGINVLEIPLVIKSVEKTGFIPYFAREYVRDISNLSQFKNLKKLSLRCCDKIKSLEPLKDLKNLQDLDIGYCNPDLDLSPIKELPNLKYLDLQGRKTSKEDINLIKSGIKKVEGEDFIETLSGVWMRMVWIESGEFMMGSPEDEKDREGPVHKVELDGFWISATQVTQEQYKLVMGNNPSDFKGKNNPVERVSWEDAKKFCRKLSERTGKEYTLPTEAQWEYSCRAGSKTRFCFGDDESKLVDYAWYGNHPGSESHPVGEKRPNDWGLFDMHGNVWEWCEDWFDENYYANSPVKNPENQKKASWRVNRGGSWIGSAGRCRSAFRDCYEPGGRDGDLGFRVAIVAGAEPFLVE
jgi:sulfatase-modifying factor enzyme 1/NACHT domain-containing protein